jgi:ribosomal protection tetracycline resistance protein
MGSVGGPGTRGAAFEPYDASSADFVYRMMELLAENDEALLEAYVDDEAGISYGRLRRGLASQTGRALVHPVFFGSAVTGAGVDSLISGITEFLAPCSRSSAAGPGRRWRTSACSPER